MEEKGKVTDPLCAVPLVAAPLYPNAIKWSQDNLLAVATGHLITILSPDSLSGPRGYIAIAASPLFDIGTVKFEDLKSDHLLPLRLLRDVRCNVRCIDWSPQGLAQNGGCLLAVCSNDHRVKLYRAASIELRAEWVEVLDISEMIYSYSCENRFLETTTFTPPNMKSEETEAKEKHLPTPTNQARYESPIREGESMEVCHVDASTPDSKSGHKSSLQELNHDKMTSPLISSDAPSTLAIKAVDGGEKPRESTYPFTRGGGLANIIKHETQELHISPSIYGKRNDMLSFLVVAWSSKLDVNITGNAQSSSLIALGAKSGEVSILRANHPDSYSVEQASPAPEITFLGVLGAHGSWVTSISWVGSYAKEYDDKHAGEEVLLATGSSDGSVKLWSGDVKILGSAASECANVPLSLTRQILFDDCIPVTSLSLTRSPQLASNMLLAVGKASGGLAVWELKSFGEHYREAFESSAHSQVVTGVIWAFNGHCLYSCSQDNLLRAWHFYGDQLIPLPFPDNSSLVGSRDVYLEADSELPSSAFDCYYGMDTSKSSLALATVRSITTDMLDPMYQSRSCKGIIKLFWIGGQHLSNRLPSDKTPRNDLLQWQSNILLSLKHFEHEKRALVLWDVIACLDFLRSVGGQDFVDTVFYEWLSGWGLMEFKDDDQIPLIFSEDLRTKLPALSTRCLQLMNVLCRRIYFKGQKIEVERENGQDEQVGEAFAARQSIMTHPPDEQHKSWRRFITQVEHELRQRLALAILDNVVQEYSSIGELSKCDDKAYYWKGPGILRMVEWAIANPSGISSQLLANKVSKLVGESSPETCSLCNALVSFANVEFAECKNKQSHKLHRCMVSMEICPLGSLWFCICCRRFASKQSPTIFHRLKYRTQISEVDWSHNRMEPYCPFCGILMQRMIPDCFLRYNLV